MIEKAPYQAVVDAAPGRARERRGQPRQYRGPAARGEELVKNGNIPKSEVDQRRAADQMAAAAILEAQAALEQAEINLGYTEIHAPIAGRIGRADLSVGNLVGPDSGVLATIVSQDPIYVTFPVSSAPAAGASARDAATARRWSGSRLPDGTLYEHPGTARISSTSRSIQGTDTVTVRAELPNPDRILVDGQFVGVRVERGEPERGARGAAGRRSRSTRPAPTSWWSAATTRSRRGASRSAMSRARRWWSRAA